MFIVYHLWTKYYVEHNKKTCRICFFSELALYVVDSDNEGLYSFTVEKNRAYSLLLTGSHSDSSWK